ncbi:TetR family transcriptional regulator C-terminal domain-containing protein [Phenylobacterium sp.]|uniref:TetR/AcrR family transcriptional regulator n=1 Tax=Phenylobacterium sp. TaxID=1871053 RepID=UPI0025E6B0B4|nr:TetR family transcriptional regulator C-terminal domain-containing protein [Phenylobacterium sp.]
MARQADHNERRKVFAAAALKVITRLGLEGLTVREVAREAGFTTGALTHYFQSKDQVLIAASEYAAEEVRGQMEEIALETSGREALRHLIHSALPTTAIKRGRWRFWVAFWERAAYSPEVGRVMRERYREWTNRLTSLIRRAQAEGDAPADLDAEHAGRELVALVDGIGVQVLIGAGKFTTPAQKQYVDSLIELRLGPVGAGAATARKPATPPAKVRRAARTPA